LRFEDWYSKALAHCHVRQHVKSVVNVHHVRIRKTQAVHVLVADQHVLAEYKPHAPDELDQVNAIPAVRAIVCVQVEHRVRVSRV